MVGNPKIGIPRGLFWYYNPDAYKIFWEALGFEVIQSPPTNRKIFEEGLKLAHDELCVPVKIFHGHIAFLKDSVDFIFVPRIVSMVKQGKKRYGCPKFIGLPELIENSVPSIPPIISVDIELDKGSLESSFLKLQKQLGLKKNVIRYAVDEMVRFQEKRESKNEYKDKNGRIKIGVVGHPYILYDPYLSLGLLDKLSSLGVDYTTSAEVPIEVIVSELKPEIDVYWIYERELIGAASFFTNNGKFDGGVHCVSFGCGPGSLMIEMIQRKIIRNKNFPFFTLVMDENTAETGLFTRLEAFCDMIKTKKG